MHYSRNYSAKCNENGDLMWWNRYDNPEFDVLEVWFNNNPGRGGMILNHNKEIISVFSTWQDSGEYDIFRDYLVKLNMFGEIVEQHYIDTSFSRYSFQGSIEDLSDSTYVVRGYYMDSLDVINNIEPDAILLKIDSLGNHIWQQEYTDTFGTFDVVKAMDGGFWLFAHTPSLGYCSDGWFKNTDLVLIKTDELGNEVATVHEYEEDKVVLMGKLTNEENTPNRMYAGYYYSTLIEQLSNDDLVETTSPKEYLPAFNGHFVDLHIIPNSGYLIVCDNQLSPQQGSGEQWRWMGGLLRLNMERDSVWFRKYSYYNNFPELSSVFPARHFLLDSKPTPDEGWVCCGYIEQQYSDPDPYLSTPWLFKVDSMGCLEPGCQNVGVKEIVIGLQNTMSVYPNPVVDVCTLQWNAELASNVQANFSESQIIIIDAMGREVQRQPVNNFGSQFQMQIDMSSFPSGLYQAHWVSGGSWLDSVQIIKQ